MHRTLSLDLRANPELATEWLDCDIGSRWMDLVVEGYEEALSATEWSVVLYGSPRTHE